jgi:drug/metabolite transporter (DMT)-like permease
MRATGGVRSSVACGGLCRVVPRNPPPCRFAAVPKISRSALISALVATVLFGSVPAAIRLIELDSIALGIVRLVLGTVGMGVFMTLQRRSSLGAFWAEVRREWWVIVAMGLLFGLHWLTYFLSIKWSSASIGTLGFSTYGAQLPLLGWAFGFGRPSRAALVGAAFALVGTWLCLPAADWSTLWTSRDAVGLAIGVISGTSYAFLPLLHQRHSHMDHEIRTWAQFALALPVFVPLVPWATWSFTGLDLLLMFYLGVIVTLIGHFLWVRATTELPIETTSILSYLQLPVTLAMNWLLLASEQITLPMLTGAGLIVLANALALGWRSTAAEELPEGQ